MAGRYRDDEAPPARPPRATVTRLGPVFALALVVFSTLAPSARADDSLPPTVLAGLEAEKARVRIATVVAISKSKDPNARRYLEGMLADPDEKVRAAACEGLERLGDPSALPRLGEMKTDKSKLVVKIATRAFTTLSKKAQAGGASALTGAVVADISDAKDLSGLAAPGLVERLRNGVGQALKADSRVTVDVREAPATEGYGLQLRVRKIDEGEQDGAVIVSVKCEMTLVKLPEKALRLQTTATSGAGLEGPLSDAEKQGLQGDAVDACAPELAKDFVEYALTRLR